MGDRTQVIPINVKKRMEAEARKPRCPWCKRTIWMIEDTGKDTHGDTYEERNKIKQGDISVCSICFKVMEWQDDKIGFIQYTPTPEEQKQVDALIRERFPHRART